MDLGTYDAFCATLPQCHRVIQWGDAHVWKVGGEAPFGAGGKVFAIAAIRDGGALHVTFKCAPMSFEVLKDAPGCRPAPYLASRGMLWIQRTGPQTLDDEAVCDYLRESRRLAAMNLPKRRQVGMV
jgi:predicted DNA-binding protein (MmcQ/YjbR family)